MTGGILVALLAAGRATRFGGGKLDAPCAGKPLGRWAIDAVAAAGIAPGILITGPQTPAFAEQALHDGWSLITNTEPERGMGGSVALAAGHAECLDAAAILFLLADMPLVDAASIAALFGHGPVTQPVAMRYPSGRPGVPARFPATMFGDLIALEGDRGAATLLVDRPDVHLLDPSAQMLIDVDDPDGLAQAARLLG